MIKIEFEQKSKEKMKQRIREGAEDWGKVIYEELKEDMIDNL